MKPQSKLGGKPITVHTSNELPLKAPTPFSPKDPALEVTLKNTETRIKDLEVSANLQQPIKPPKNEMLTPRPLSEIKTLEGLYERHHKLVSSLANLNIEMCLELANGQRVWLVPEKTNENRKEITFEEAATMTLVCSSYRGQVVEMLFK